MSPGQRIVVFTGNPAYSVRKGIVEIDAALGGLEWLVLVHRPPRTPARLWRNQWLNLRRNGWRWIPHQLNDLWQGLRAPRGAAPGADVPGAAYEAAALRAMPNVRFEPVGDLHHEDTLAQVRAFAPDLGLSLAAPILRRSLFSIPKLGTVNLHKGRLPDYRGMPPAFWELWNDEQDVGCSVHWVDDKLDTGALVARATLRRQKFSTLRGLQLGLDEIGVDLMRDAVRDILAGRSGSLPQNAGGRTYRKPTLAQTAALERRMAALQPADAGGLMALARVAAAWLLWSAWRLGLRRLMAPRVTVMLYHRVSDDARDNLTVGIEQFERQMAQLARHCQPVSLEHVLSLDAVPRGARPLVAVTFDDGYLDNFSHAAPILQRHRIPAAFFVSTGIVDSDRPFPHDVRRGNQGIPNMRWEHLRRMRDMGFTIGSHAVNHIDCAAEPADAVRLELKQSRTDLERELGATEVVFAYPYGGRQHMTAERLEMVKQAGYTACLSAYGGSNVARVDRYNVLRRGIHWGFGDLAFLRQCLGTW